jgi:hypothetical protein
MVRINGENVFTQCLILNFEGLIGAGVIYCCNASDTLRSLQLFLFHFGYIFTTQQKTLLFEFKTSAVVSSYAAALIMSPNKITYVLGRKIPIKRFSYCILCPPDTHFISRVCCRWLVGKISAN